MGLEAGLVPIITENNIAFQKLQGVVDYILVHNRKIALLAGSAVAVLGAASAACLVEPRTYAQKLRS